MHLGLHRQCGFSWLSTVTWKIRLPLMLEEARDSLSFLAWRPMLNFLVNCILNEQFSSASLNGIIWMAWWSTGFISITIYVCQHVSLVVFTHRGMGQRLLTQSTVWPRRLWDQLPERDPNCTSFLPPFSSSVKSHLILVGLNRSNAGKALRKMVNSVSAQ